MSLSKQCVSFYKIAISFNDFLYNQFTKHIQNKGNDELIGWLQLLSYIYLGPEANQTISSAMFENYRSKMIIDELLEDFTDKEYINQAIVPSSLVPEFKKMLLKDLIDILKNSIKNYQETQNIYKQVIPKPSKTPSFGDLIPMPNPKSTNILEGPEKFELENWASNLTHQILVFTNLLFPRRAIKHSRELASITTTSS